MLQRCKAWRFNVRNKEMQRFAPFMAQDVSPAIKGRGSGDAYFQGLKPLAL